MRTRDYGDRVRRLGGLAAVAAAVVGVASDSHAATITKADTTVRLSDTGSWTGGVVPGTGDIALFDSTLTAALTTANLGGNYAMGNVQVTGIGGLLTLGVGAAGAATALNLNNVDMSAATADVTFGSVVDGGQVRINSASGSFSLTVASGRTLTFNSRFTNNGNTKTATLTGGGNIVFNASAGSGGAMSFDITGGTNVTMNGTGSWTGATVTNGTLNLGSDTAVSGNPINLGGTSAVTPTLVAVGGARTIANNISLNAVTTGAATFGGSNALTVTGAITGNSGSRTLTVNNSALTTLGNVFLSSDNTTAGRVMTINGSGNAVVAGTIANNNVGNTVAAGLTYAGPGTLTLSGANTYSGATTISSGTVKVGNAAALGTGRTSLASGATIDLNGTNLGVPSLYNSGALSGGTVDNVSAGGNVTLTVGGGIGGNSAIDTTYTSIASFNGVIKNTTGTVGVTKIASTSAGASIISTASRLTGPSVFSLTGTNTYTGATTIKSGFVQLLNQSATPIISSSSPLILAGGSLVLINNTAVSPTQTFAGTTLNAGGSHIGNYRQGSTTLTLNLGAITRNTGSTLNFQERPASGSSNGTLGASDGTNRTTTANANFAGGSATILGGYAVFGSSWATSTANGTGGVGDIGVLSTYSSTLTAGANVDVLNGGFSTTGALTVNSLRFLNATASTSNAYAVGLGGDLTVATGGILAAATGASSAANSTIYGNYNLTSGNGQDLIFITNNLSGGTGTANMSVGANLANYGATPIGLTKAGLGTLFLSPATANTFTGQVTINAGTVFLLGPNAFNGNNVVFGGSSELHGAGTAGTSTVIANGTLQLGGNSATVGTLASSTDSSGTAIIQNASATPAILTTGNASSATFAGTIQNGTGGGALALTKTGNGTQTLTGANAFTGDITINGGTLDANRGNNIDNPVTGALGNTAVARNITVNGGTLKFSQGDTMGSALTTPAATLVINNGGTVTNNGNNFTTLGAIALNGGTLTGTGGSGNSQYAMYQLRGNVAVGGTTASTISGSGNATAKYHLNNAITFTVADATANRDVDLNVTADLIDGIGAIPAAASLVKAGPGTMAVSGNNVYTNGTTVSAGTLAANGSTSALGSGVVNVNSGGTLAGTGRVTGAVNVNAGSVVTAGTGATAGDTPGTLTNTATQTWTGNGTTESAGGTYAWKIGTVATDKLEITLLNIAAAPGSKFTIRPLNAGGTFAPFTPYTLAHIAGLQVGGVTQGAGDLTSLFYLDLNGVGYADNDSQFAVAAVSDGGSGFDLQMQAAPEPTVVALVGLAAAPLLGRRRRKLHRAA